VLNFTVSRKRSIGQLLESAGLRLSGVGGEEHLVRFDLMLRMHEAEGDLAGSWVYSTELFEPATILSLHERFMRLIHAILEHSEASLSEIEREAAAEEERERRSARLERNRRELRAAKPKVVQL
jgi:non-ribosomal peptide synthetase component F